MKSAEERLRYKAEHSPEFSFVAGSRLYGTDTKNSDDDIRGFVVPSLEYLLGVKTFESLEFPEKDHKIYSLKYFLQLALKGDPLCVEAFFVPENKILHTSEIANDIFFLKSDIISMRIFRRIMGYSYSEWRKAMGQRMLIDERTKTEDDVINDVRNMFSPDKLDMDKIIEILLAKKPRRIVPSKRDIGAKRKKEFDDYGYGVSCATHCVRLVTELHELITTGKITFPHPQVDLLKDIRQGKLTKKEVTKIYEEKCLKVKNDEDNSVLPDKPNEKKVWNIYLELIKNILRKGLESETRIEKDKLCETLS